MTTEQSGPTIPATRLGEVPDLRPDTQQVIELKAESKVLCVNRGGEIVRDTFDSRHYKIPPGFFSTDYGAALHFKARAVVPGSRNPETGFQASFIAIIGIVAPTPEGMKVVVPVDDPIEWDVFTDEERRQYGLALEALDRGAMTDPIDANVEVVPLAGNSRPGDGGQAQSRVKGGGAPAAGARRKPNLEGPGADALKKKGAAGENEATRMIGQDRVAQSAPAPIDEPDLGEMTGKK